MAKTIYSIQNIPVLKLVVLDTTVCSVHRQQKQTRRQTLIKTLQFLSFKNIFITSYDIRIKLKFKQNIEELIWLKIIS